MAKKKKTSKKSKQKNSHLFAWILLIVLILALGFWGYSYLKSPIYPSQKAIPDDAFLVFESNHPKDFWDALNYDNQFWKGLHQSSSIAKISKTIQQWDAVLMKDDDFWNVIEENTFYWSLHADKENIQSLFIIGLNNAHQEKNVNRLMHDMMSEQVEILKNTYLDFNYYSLVDQSTKFYYSVPYGIFIASESLPLLKKSLQQLQDGNGLMAQNDFKEIKATCGKKVDANIFISPKKLHFLSQKMAHNAPFAVLKNLENLALWNGLDLYIKSDSWSLNGYSSIADADILVLFQAQQPVANQGLYILPQETSAWMQMGFSDPSQFFDNLQKYQSKSNVLNAINQKFNISLIDDFKSCIDQEIYFAWVNNAPVLLMHLFDIERATTTMLKLSDKKIDYHSGDILRLNSMEFCNAVFGDNLFSIRPSYWSIFGEYLVLTETTSTMKTVVESQHNITETKQYQAMTENMVDHSNFSFCCNLSQGEGFIRKNSAKKLFQSYKNQKDLVQDFNGFCIQFSASSGLFYTNAILSYDVEAKMELPPEPITEITSIIDSTEVIQNSDSEVVVSSINEPDVDLEQQQEISSTSTDLNNHQLTKLQGTMILKPYPIEDHTTKDKKLVVFDNKSNMYLIDQNGTIIWSKILHDNPISDVYQVDYYANGKIQYLFSSKNYLYMIDRKGNWVSGYPKKLSESAQNPIFVFDYQQKKDYRIVFVDQKGNIQHYTKEGKMVGGWEKPVLNHKISSAATICRSGNELWLIFQMDNGKVLIT
ncbi:MAG: hypothetical protein PHR53_08175, partial [Bacteroidales bacterium]|nr:hypothetical protein [Bacteroidales bacterium]